MKLKIDNFYRHKKNILKFKGSLDGRLLFDTYIRDLKGSWVNGGEVTHGANFSFLLSPTLPPA